MIERKNFFALAFYKKSAYSGSYNNMNFKIEKQEIEKEEGTEKFFKVTYWPGPYNFKTTADELKTEAQFPFSEEGLEAVAAFLNEQYEAKKEIWESVVIR